MALSSNTAVLQKYLALDGLRVLDVGSGSGSLVRYMTRKGATVTGLECGAAQLAKARSTPPEGNEEYVEGFGQNLPFHDASFDAVVFFNSLHHIPVDAMDPALGEARRVLVGGGILYIAEPVATGPMFQLYAPVDDETEVRAQAIAAIDRAISGALKEITTVHYDTACHYAGYDEMREEGIRIDPSRRAAFDSNDSLMRASFTRLGVPDDEGYRFAQPMRVNILQKPVQE